MMAKCLWSSQVSITILIHELQQFVVIRGLTVKSNNPCTWFWFMGWIVRQVYIKDIYQECIKGCIMDCIKGIPFFVLELYLPRRRFCSPPPPHTGQIETLLLLGQTCVEKKHWLGAHLLRNETSLQTMIQVTFKVFSKPVRFSRLWMDER